MKRAFFFAIVTLLLPLALSQPASATGRISVQNAMGEPIKVDIIYKTFPPRGGSLQSLRAGRAECPACATSRAGPRNPALGDRRPTP